MRWVPVLVGQICASLGIEETDAGGHQARQQQDDGALPQDVSHGRKPGYGTLVVCGMCAHLIYPEILDSPTRKTPDRVSRNSTST